MARIARRVVPIAVLAAFTASGIALATSLPSASADSTQSVTPSGATTQACRASTTTPSTIVTAESGENSASVGINVHTRVLGGQFQLATDHLDIDAQRQDGNRFVGRFDDVRFMDVRGTYAGWTLSASVTKVDVDGHSVDATVRVVPDDIVVLNGFTTGLENPGPQGGAASFELGRATAGCGAGIYAVSGSVEVDLSGDVEADGVTLGLDLQLT
jgi:hypothetical protein